MEQLSNTQLRKIRDLLAQGYGYESAYQMMKLNEKREQDEEAARQRIFNQQIKDAQADFNKYRGDFTVQDPWGNTFPSKSKMLKHYKTNWWQVQYLMSKGMGLDWALTHPDFEKARAEAIKLRGKMAFEKAKKAKEASVLNGIKNKTTLQSIAEAKAKFNPMAGKYRQRNSHTKVRNVVKDYLGNEFSSKTEMCKAWGIDYATFSRRMNQYGWSLEQSLITPPYCFLRKRRVLKKKKSLKKA